MKVQCFRIYLTVEQSFILCVPPKYSVTSQKQIQQSFYTTHLQYDQGCPKTVTSCGSSHLRCSKGPAVDRSKYEQLRKGNGWRSYASFDKQISIAFVQMRVASRLYCSIVRWAGY